ncbi:phage tail tape measure protein, TP901 family, core region [Ochrobactrum quorumnocens]|uniref:Phage tail tape measure protein, TP901 family, core region n=1 Tax=Ochrobactrum quorumnocens TaxID=271865 RepID=A0A248UM23_9HYPH|nr:phage tail tape measure protein [[Ochrobactrum] quorumnocens]ASV87728.1 phage tail tape measure protein, TP901 family, core region [[Ochrobactrum] quorumnocens]
MGTLVSKLIVSLVNKISGPARVIGADLDRLHSRASRTSSALLRGPGGFSAAGSVRNLVAIGAGYVGLREGIGGTVGAAIKFEEAFADVRKVVDGTPAQIAVLRNEIVEMSKVIPTSVKGLSDIMAAAGQSNVPYEELGKFTEQVAKVSVAWETSEKDTSDALAKIKTQLNLSVDGVGLYADAINHLGNNTAAKAPDLVDFSKRVAATGKMFGFSATETLAFGGAMVAMGAETEVAATSFRNMGKALTKGDNTAKAARAAWARIGMSPKAAAKDMQKNAVKTTLKVLDAIGKLPEWERATNAFALFGEEARALMPVISDTKELRRQLGLVGREADYAGSAFQEYMVRADTTANVLELLGNKLSARGIKYGDTWLPTLKEFSLGVGDVVDTLDKRVGVIDKIQMALTGLVSGLGYGGTGGVREMVNDLGDILFGKAFEGDTSAFDQRMVDLAKLSNHARKIGSDIKSFVSDIGAGDISGAMTSLGSAFDKMSGSMTVGSALAIGLVGRGLMGISFGAIALAASPIGRITTVAFAAAKLIDAVKGADSIGAFADNLMKLSTVDWVMIGAGLLAVAGPIAKVAGLGGGPKAGGPTGAPPAGAGSGGSAPTAGGGWKSFARGGVFAVVAEKLGEYAIQSGLDALNDRVHTDEQKKKAADFNATHNRGISALWDRSFWLGDDDGKRPSFKETMAIDVNKYRPPASSSPENVNIVGTPPVALAAPVQTVPSGTQDVRVTNPPPAAQISVAVNVQTNASPSEIGAAVGNAISAKLQAASNGAYSDGGM